MASQDADATTQTEVDVVASPPPATVSGKCSAVTLKVTPASPVASGALVIATAQASGCSNAEYRFGVVSITHASTVVDGDWGPSNTFQWNTSGQPADRYSILVSVRVSGENEPVPDAGSSVEVDVTN